MIAKMAGWPPAEVVANLTILHPISALIKRLELPAEIFVQNSRRLATS
jgi:hypothetical protein